MLPLIPFLAPPAFQLRGSRKVHLEEKESSLSLGGFISDLIQKSYIKSKVDLSEITCITSTIDLYPNPRTINTDQWELAPG